jgi:phosphatidylglycerophosphate synthase
MITLTTPILGSLLCFWVVQSRAIVPFCVAMGVVEVLDGLDGAVARVSGRVTKFGAYLDALCDRYVDVMVIIATAQVSGYWLLSMVVLSGSLLISYAKARAAMEVPVSNLEWPDLMERTERNVIFLVGFAAGEVFPWKPFGHGIFWWVLVLLGFFIHLTVVQRVLRARRLIVERAGSS